MGLSCLGSPLAQFPPELTGRGQRGEDELAVDRERRKGNDANFDRIIQLIERIEFAPDNTGGDLIGRSLERLPGIGAFLASGRVKKLDFHRLSLLTPFARSSAAPAYLVRDNDRAYGHVFTSRIRTMGIRDRPISPGSPWQNAYAERLIGTLRRECLDQWSLPVMTRYRTVNG